MERVYRFVRGFLQAKLIMDRLNNPLNGVEIAKTAGEKFQLFIRAILSFRIKAVV